MERGRRSAILDQRGATQPGDPAGHVRQRAAAPPFNSTDVSHALPWRFSPSLPGLRNASLGSSVRCVDNAFVIPYDADERYISFEAPDAPVTGTADVWIKARAPTAGKEITVHNTNGGVYVAKATQALTASFAWYKVFEKIQVTNLVPFVLNKDRIHAGDIHLGELVITLT